MKKIVWTAALLLIFSLIEVHATFWQSPKIIEALDHLLHITHGHRHCTQCVPSELQNLPYGVYPTSPNYYEARHNFNMRFNYFPCAIFSPRTIEEAQHVLRALIAHQLNFSIRSGRHCFEPGSLSPDFIFDLGHFNAISPDIEKETVYLGAACRLGDVIAALGSLNYAIPTGTCPTVGVAGLTMGGGIGLLARPYGLTCDSVLSITLLNAHAEVIEVNANNHSDLFWALRGGGSGSYGIVLGFTFKMIPIPIATFYELLWEWDPTLIPEIIPLWQKWVQTLPINITSVLGLRHPPALAAHPHLSPPQTIRIFGLKVGAEPFTEWEAAFSTLNPRVTTFQGRYVDTAKYWASESDLPYNKAKSRILMEPIGEQTITEVTQFFQELEEKQPEYLVYFNFEALGGKVKENETAFFPKDAFGWWFQAYFWSKKQETNEVLALSRHFYARIPKQVSKYCFANIIDYDLGKSYLKRYYGNHVSKLIAIKRVYDPQDIFHWKQGIPLKKPCSK